MTTHDVIVIGGGHNGLVTATALARKDRTVLLLEQHESLGGLAIGDEFHPGYRSVGPLHDLSCFTPKVLSDLDLELTPVPAPVFAPQLPGEGPGLLLHHDPGMAADEISVHSQRDATRYADYRGFMERIRPFLERVLEQEPPSPNSILSIIGPALRLRRLGRADMLEILRVAPMCLADWLNEHFETELLSCTLALPAITGTSSGPWSPGNTANLLRYEALSRNEIKGGTGALIDALELKARERGVSIRTGARVERIRTEGGRVQGVTLSGGEEIEAPIIAASCDPKQALLELLAPTTLSPRLHHRMTRVRASGSMAIVDVALAKPLRFACRPDLEVARARLVRTLDDMERAFDATKYGRCSPDPVMEIVVPSLEGPGMAPEGHHVASIMTHYAPYELKAGWNDDAVNSLAETVMDWIEQYAPGFKESIIAHRVRTPVELEARYGTTGGHIHHAEHALDQLIVRPDPECARYATPIQGLYLCGSGSHPGGGLTGVPGLLAAGVID